MKMVESIKDNVMDE